MKLLKLSIGIGAAVFASALLFGVLSVGSAKAQYPPTPTPTPIVITVDTEAEVLGGGGAAPVVDAKWELPDMQIHTYGMQYYGASGPTDLNNNDIYDADDDPYTPGMQMYPILCDDPNDPSTQRLMEYWLIAEDETGLADIISTFDKVFQPGLDSGETVCPDGDDPVDGYCFKYQVDLEVVDCALIGDWDENPQGQSVVTLADPILAAIDTNQITEEAAETLVIRCEKGEVLVAMAQQTIATHEPAGIYEVTAYAQDHNSNLGTLDNTFEVLPIVGLQIDFSVVDWGSIQANITDVVSGDEDLSTSDAPTLKDCGNVNVAIGLEFATMYQQGVPGAKTITTFDARLLNEELDFVADAQQFFQNCLIPCHPKELDVSVHPPSTLPPGVYAGTLDITAIACDDVE